MKKLLCIVVSVIILMSNTSTQSYSYVDPNIQAIYESLDFQEIEKEAARVRQEYHFMLGYDVMNFFDREDETENAPFNYLTNQTDDLFTYSIMNEAEYFSYDEVMEIAKHHTNEYLGNRINGEHVTISDDFVYMYNTNDELIAYMVPLINNNDEAVGNINIDARSDGYNFYAMEEKGESFIKAKKLQDEGQKIIFLPPMSYLIKSNDVFYSLDGQVVDLDEQDESSMLRGMTNEMFLQNLYLTMRNEENIIKNQRILNGVNRSRVVEREEVKLTNEETFLQMYDGKDEFYGGNQDWYVDDIIVNRGCGPTAAANITAYLAKKKTWAKLYNYDKNNITKDDFTKHMNEVIQYVAPNTEWWQVFPGMPSMLGWSVDVVDFAKSRGVSLNPQFRDFAGFNFEKTTNFIKQGLMSDSPVAFLMYYNPKLSRYNWHWMTITKYFRDTADNRYVAVSTWGERHSLNWDWLWNSSMYSDVMYFY